MERKVSWSSGRRVGLVLALWIGACAAPPEPTEAPPRFVAAAPALVIEAASAVLSRDGYKLAPLDPDASVLTGTQERTLSRSTDGLLPGTELTTQIVVEASETEAGAAVMASFSIRSRRPTGEYRIWVPESPLGQRLRSRFF